MYVLLLGHTYCLITTEKFESDFLSLMELLYETFLITNLLNIRLSMLLTFVVKKDNRGEDWGHLSSYL